MAKDSISAMLWRANIGSELWVSNPTTVEKLVARGENIQAVKLPSAEESIKNLFNERMQSALKIAETFPLCPLYEPPLVALYDEIRMCLLFGLNGTAIIWCGTLLEFALKYVCFLKRYGNEKEFNIEGWKETVESMSLARAIDRAKREGFIDDNIKSKLVSFKDDVRNPYTHFNIQKITEYVVFGRVQVKNVETGETTEQDMPASSNPVFQLVAKKKVDDEQVMKVFLFVDSVVHHLFVMLQNESEEQ